jgi:hypothetical protein
MATNAAPIYGKQYIRYAETWEAAVDAEAGSPDALAAATTVGIVEVGELRVVVPATYAGPGVAADPGAIVGFAGTVCGVNQAYMPTALAQPYTARQMTVANSGLLLVEVAPAAAAIQPNSPLRVNLLGQAVDAGGQIAAYDGTQPTVREAVNIGGRKLVLVSWA